MLSSLINFIQQQDGINDKFELANRVCKEFMCIKDRSIYYTEKFAIRFCKANSISSFSNTVLSLSTLQKYDNRPVIVCISTPSKNYMLLANSSFISKISHSSKELQIDNIKGSFNGSDIIKIIDKVENLPKNFDILFAIHQNISFEENLERIVNATNNISPTGKKFNITTETSLNNILSAPYRADLFSNSLYYQKLLNDLNTRTKEHEDAILVAACIENVNLRGRIIEYIIAGDDARIRSNIIDFLLNKNNIPEFVTHDDLGDYSKIYPGYYTKTDIKTKIMVLTSAPKGYNIDKVLEFLSQDDSIFMLFFVGIDYEKKTIATKLVSMFQEKLVDNIIIQNHWAGRNSRGVSQFNGNVIKDIILNESNSISIEKSISFLNKLINL